MSLFRRKEPDIDPRKKPPKRFWEAAEPFVDLRMSHWVEIILTCGLVAIGVLQWIVYRKQTGIMAAQSAIANLQTTIANQQLLLSKAVERPWIGILDETPISELSLKNPGLFTVEFSIKNFGQLPATNIWLEGEVNSYVFGTSISTIVSAAKGFCANLRKNRSGPVLEEGFTLMPGGNAPRRVIFQITKNDIEDISTSHKWGNITLPIQLNGLGRVDYTSPGDFVHHQTPFEFEIDKAGPGNGLAPLSPNEVIQARFVRLAVHPNLAINAD